MLTGGVEHGKVYKYEKRISISKIPVTRTSVVSISDIYVSYNTPEA